jgi:hypothetical protein
MRPSPHVSARFAIANATPSTRTTSCYSLPSHLTPVQDTAGSRWMLHCLPHRRRGQPHSVQILINPPTAGRDTGQPVDGLGSQGFSLSVRLRLSNLFSSRSEIHSKKIREKNVCKVAKLTSDNDNDNCKVAMQTVLNNHWLIIYRFIKI